MPKLTKRTIDATERKRRPGPIDFEDF